MFKKKKLNKRLRFDIKMCTHGNIFFATAVIMKSEASVTAQEADFVDFKLSNI